eukprot:TRINITY_DN10975_c0_g1_i4.p1 TRINITY_DN10975_c0_g1~~TRINITY_DN10975_c0_g1_i4.p1  ORF type:complete len:753 (+),score=146.90 TRINITY_DN10975_c0_g1_i4:271-2259(+)
MYCASKQTVAKVATYAYALPDPAIAAVATPTRVFVLCRDSTAVLQSYTSRSHRPDLGLADSDMDACTQALPGFDGLVAAPCTMPEVLWLGSDPMDACMQGLAVADDALLLLSRAETGTTTIHVHPLTGSLALFAQVTDFADQTPQAHPNVFHMLAEVNLQLRTLLAHNGTVASMDDDDQLVTAWQDSSRRLLALPCQPVRQLALTAAVQPEQLPTIMSAMLTNAVEEPWPLISAVCLHLHRAASMQDEQAMAILSQQDVQTTFFRLLETQAKKALADGVLRFAALKLLSLGDVGTDSLTASLRQSSHPLSAIAQAVLNPDAPTSATVERMLLEEAIATPQLGEYRALVVTNDGKPGPLLGMLASNPEATKALLLSQSWLAPSSALAVLAVMYPDDSVHQVFYVLTLLDDQPRWHSLAQSERGVCLQQWLTAYLHMLKEEPTISSLPRPTVGLVGRPSWLDLLPPFAPGYVPGVAASAAVLSVFRLIQAFLWHHVDATSARQLLKETTVRKWKDVPGLLSLMALLYAKCNNVQATTRLLLASNPNSIVDMLETCSVKAEHIVSVLGLVNELLDSVVNGQVQLVATQDEQHLFTTVYLAQDDLQTQRLKLLSLLSRYLGPMELLELMPDTGDAFLHLPILDACIKHRQAQKLQQDLIASSVPNH